MGYSLYYNELSTAVKTIYFFIGHLDKLLRSLVLAKLGSYGDEETIAEARKRFEDHVIKKKIIPADLRACVYRAVRSTGDESTFETMINVSFGIYITKKINICGYLKTNLTKIYIITFFIYDIDSCDYILQIHIFIYAESYFKSI